MKTENSTTKPASVGYVGHPFGGFRMYEMPAAVVKKPEGGSAKEKCERVFFSPYGSFFASCTPKADEVFKQNASKCAQKFSWASVTTDHAVFKAFVKCMKQPPQS